MIRALAHRCGLAVGFVLLLAPCVLVAAPAGPEAPAKDAGPAENLKKQLDQNVTLEINDQSLSAAINQIREQTKINFVVDKLTIQQMGMDPEQMLVNTKLKDVKARTALRAVLSPYNLGYAIIGDTVLVSTDDMAMYRQLHQRVNIDLEKVTLGAALKKLSKDTAANVLLDPRVAAKDAGAAVTLQMEDVPLETAVRLMSEMAGLKPVRVGNVLFVTTKIHANEIRADEQLNQPGQPQPGMIIETGGVVVPQPPQPQPVPGDPKSSTTAPPPPAEKVDPDKPASDKAETPKKDDKEGKDPKPESPAKPEKP